MTLTYKKLANLSERATSELSTLYKNIETENYSFGLTAKPMSSIIDQCPSVIDWFQKQAGQIPWLCYVVCTPPGASVRNAHVDSWYETSINDLSAVTSCVAAINIPLINCAETYTSFYRYLSGPIKKMHFERDKITYVYYGDANLEEIDRYHLTGPIILNTSVPHSVVNDTSNLRFALSFRFEVDPWKLFES